MVTRDDFLRANYAHFASWLPAARLVNVLLSIGCGWLIFLWSRQLFGRVAALVALSLWSFSPNVLAWAGICTTPGWYAISVNFVCGMSFYTSDETGKRIRVPSNAYRYFQQFQPVDKAGYSIFIYHLTLSDVNRVRRSFSG